MAEGSLAPKLGSRIAVTWAELTVAGLAGGALGTSVGGPPGLVVSVGILLYNVNALVERSVRHHLDCAPSEER